MSYILVIVESPAKCKKIESYLGPGYKCLASFGHLQQLSSLNNIDISNNFKPKFSIIESKIQQINKIKQAVSLSKEVILATDDDREGEAISWHICQLFDLPVDTTKRIIFHEITKPAITKAVKNPTTLNMDLVYAQLARQILDLIVGYKISPILWEFISRTMKLSAGRCQTPALRLVYENQLEIDKSPGTKSYNTTGYFTDKNLPFILNYCYDDDDKMVNFLELTTEFNHILTCDKPKDSIRKAPTPFTTSQLQQTSSNELHISPKDTMQICQKLYEAGYITYMRTDSKIYSKEFVESAIQYINKTYGEEYSTKNIEILTDSSASKSSKKKSKKEKDNAQEAHEAIRPTNISITSLPEDGDFSGKERRLYNLIWKNTAESCMADAIFKTILAHISAPENHEYKFTCENLVFLGYKIIDYNHKEESVIDSTKKLAYEYLPKLKSKELNYKVITSKFSLKDLKTHYTEAKLVQLLEQKGIGRPSTFSSLIEKIQERGYVKKENIKGKTIKCIDFQLENDEILETEKEREFGNENNKLVIQQTGILVIKLLLDKYPNIFNYEYTKQMEDILDIIAKGEKKYYELCKDCLDEIDKVGLTFNNDDKILGKYKNYDLVIKKGKFGNYVTWGDNKKSLNGININIDDITLDDVVDFINKSTKNNILRKIDKNTSIRNGQYGPYIFYKTEKMNKPKFIKLTGLNEDYINCNKEIILSWISDKI
jgi:DNA topoisomerase-1